MLRVKLKVEVWVEEDPSDTEEVEVILDDPFTLAKLSETGTALQRGVYEALEYSTRRLLGRKR